MNDDEQERRAAVKKAIALEVARLEEVVVTKEETEMRQVKRLMRPVRYGR